ncbi:Protein ENHANCED DISEASE RESISTANCE 2 [Quillaja saponaria]|uniref:Protein ENHANCED DISEASE RESISTANCE 2 n=1 Tax=Quillaja saponaria TaxID=32244 RepID=A0AAD7Q483_QUISA|nr:Protein ENHANCED DISEASE RESISTANCE 2 [Quillaja saponaria]
MGACASRPKQDRDNGRSGMSRGKNRRRRRILRKRVSSRKIDVADLFGKSNPSYSNPTFQDVAWFDSTSALDSECDEEFYSVYDDVLSLNGSEITSRMSTSSSKVMDSNYKDFRESNSILKAPKRVNAINSQPKYSISQLTLDNLQVVTNPVFPKEVSTSRVDEAGDEKKLGIPSDYCGLLPNTCLPCLASTALSVEKRRPSSPDTPSSRRKSLSKLSFKWREGHPDLTLFSPKALKQRPVAGSSVPLCPIEKQMPDSWSPIEPSSFKVRGKNYIRDKKKDFAPNCAAFYPFGADIFLSQRKIDHIARFVQLPTTNIAGEVPSILVVNVQIPLYPATIFQSENDGEGMNLVLYFKLSEKYLKELPLQFQENISRLINDEVERVRGFPLDTIAPFRERLKILGRVANMEDLSLSGTEKKLMNAYNEKPVLSRPQHEFYLGENYLEIDLDVHRFSYISRKGFDAFHDRLKLCFLDFGLTIQGNKAEDLPEHILCGIRLNKIDHTNYNQLGF